MRLPLFVLFVFISSQALAEISDFVPQYQDLRIESILEIPGKPAKVIPKTLPNEPWPVEPNRPNQPLSRSTLVTLENVDDYHYFKTGQRAIKPHYLKMFVYYPFWGFIRDVTDLPFTTIDYIGRSCGWYIDFVNKVDKDSIFTLVLIPVGVVAVVGKLSIVLSDVLILGHVNMTLSRLGTGELNWTYSSILHSTTIDDIQTFPVNRQGRFFPNLQNWKFKKRDIKRLETLKVVYNAEIDGENETNKENYAHELASFEKKEATYKAYARRYNEFAAPLNEHNSALKTEIETINNSINLYNDLLATGLLVSIKQLETLQSLIREWPPDSDLAQTCQRRRQTLDLYRMEYAAISKALDGASIAILEDVIEKYPLSPYIRFARERLHELLKDAAVTKAREQCDPLVLSDFLAGNPQTPFKKEIKQLIWELSPRVIVTGNINLPEIPVYKKPLFEDIEVDFILQKNMECLMLNQTDNGFIQIELADGRTGYVHKATVRHIPKPCDQ